jgi:hypothetical protein
VMDYEVFDETLLINGSVSAQSFRLPVVAVAMLPQFAE